MDKWDQMMQALREASTEKDSEKAVFVAVNFITEIARAFEQIGADLDRIATALEKQK